jgi:membrane protease YdiL (CAAX protease family)
MSKKFLKIAALFFYLLLIWGFYRFFTNFPEWQDELFFKPLIWLAPVWFLVRKVEKKRLESLGLIFDKPEKNFLLGLAIGLIILTQYLLALILKGEKLNFNPQDLSFFNWLLYFLVCLATGFVEEITFRGFFMTRIDEIIQDKLYANIIAGLLFFFIHFPILVFDQNQSLRGIIEYFILSLSLGLFDGYAFWRTKGILAPIVAHSSLNFFSLLVG